MNSKTLTSQKIGLVVFAIGGLYMFGLGWLSSWRMVSAANQVGDQAYSNLFGIFWQLSVPLGAFIVAIGAALLARAERRVIWMLVLLLVLVTGGKMAYSSGQLVSALFGIGGGLITAFFLGSTYQYARIRPTLSRAGKTGSDLRMIGFIFFVVAAWYLCGVFGIGNFVLRPELADRFSVPVGSTINAASVVMVLLVLGWGFTYVGQLVSRPVPALEPEIEKVPQIVPAD
jgi:hypothetical protein